MDPETTGYRQSACMITSPAGAGTMRKHFSGYLTCDGFSGYNKLKNVTRCGCLAHMRQYWYEALPGKNRKSPGRTPAEIGFDYCNRLFELEREYADLDAVPRKTKRLETENYLLDGRCSISNNIAENIARPYAAGRKNFLFHDTVKGGGPVPLFTAW